jgi:hypothetical protein
MAQESDVSEQLDEGFLKAFAKIKQRDASIYNADARLFDAGSPGASEEDESDEGNASTDSGAPTDRRKEHPKFLRQVLAEQASQNPGPLPEVIAASYAVPADPTATQSHNGDELNGYAVYRHWRVARLVTATQMPSGLARTRRNSRM